MKAHTCIDKGRFEFELVGKPKPGNTRVKKSVPPEKKTRCISKRIKDANEQHSHRERESRGGADDTFVLPKT